MYACITYAYNNIILSYVYVVRQLENESKSAPIPLLVTMASTKIFNLNWIKYLIWIDKFNCNLDTLNAEYISYGLLNISLNYSDIIYFG